MSGAVRYFILVHQQSVSVATTALAIKASKKLFQDPTVDAVTLYTLPNDFTTADSDTERLQKWDELSEIPKKKKKKLMLHFAESLYTEL